MTETRHDRYNHSEKGRARVRRYEATEKRRKAKQDRYFNLTFVQRVERAMAQRRRAAAVRRADRDAKFGPSDPAIRAAIFAALDASVDVECIAARALSRDAG